MAHQCSMVGYTLGSYPTTTTISPPYPISKALLWVEEIWITSHIPKHITIATHLNAIHEYCIERYCWTSTTFDSVYWDGIGQTQHCSMHTQLMHTSKLMHGWLLLNHVVGHYTRITQCPCFTAHTHTWSKQGQRALHPYICF